MCSGEFDHDPTTLRSKAKPGAPKVDAAATEARMPIKSSLHVGFWSVNRGFGVCGDVGGQHVAAGVPDAQRQPRGPQDVRGRDPAGLIGGHLVRVQGHRIAVVGAGQGRDTDGRWVVLGNGGAADLGIAGVDAARVIDLISGDGARCDNICLPKARAGTRSSAVRNIDTLQPSSTCRRGLPARMSACASVKEQPSAAITRSFGPMAPISVTSSVNLPSGKSR